MWDSCEVAEGLPEVPTDRGFLTYGRADANPGRDTMTRARRSLLASTLLTGILLATAAPAMAGDTGAPLRSPVGDWRTKTHGVA